MLKIKEIVKLDSKGRIVIPRSIREDLGVKPGAKFYIILSEDEEGSIISLLPER